MKNTRNVLAIAAIFLASPAYAQAPTWSDEQAEAWEVVTQSWVDDAGENEKWPKDYAHESMISWGPDQLAPRDVETYAKWERMNEERIDTIWYEVTPMSIVVEGDTAVVMYYALTGEEDKEGKREMSRSGITEALIRDGRSWKFLASTSFTTKGD